MQNENQADDLVNIDFSSIENNNKIPDITYLIEDKNQTVKYLEVCIKNEFINNRRNCSNNGTI